MWGLDSFRLQGDSSGGKGETSSGPGSQLWAPSSPLLYALAFGQAHSYWQYDWESPQRAPKPDRSRFSRSMTVVPILSSGENRSKSYSSISRSFSRGMVQLSSNILVGWRWRPQRPRPCYLHASPLASLPLGPCSSPWFGPVTVENRARRAVSANNHHHVWQETSDRPVGGTWLPSQTACEDRPGPSTRSSPIW